MRTTWLGKEAKRFAASIPRFFTLIFIFLLLCAFAPWRDDRGPWLSLWVECIRLPRNKTCQNDLEVFYRPAAGRGGTLTKVGIALDGGPCYYTVEACARTPPAMFIEIWMRGGPTPDAEVHPPLGVLRLFAWKHVRAVRACGMPENLTERNNMENAQILHLTETNFQSEVLDSPQPVLVDFWAPWCGPCRMLAPTLENLATTYAGKVRVGKVNVDDNQRLAATYRIEGIPTVMLFQDGQAVQSLVGVHPADDFQRLLDSHVAKD